MEPERCRRSAGAVDSQFILAKAKALTNSREPVQDDCKRYHLPFEGGGLTELPPLGGLD